MFPAIQTTYSWLGVRIVGKAVLSCTRIKVELGPAPIFTKGWAVHPALQGISPWVGTFFLCQTSEPYFVFRNMCVPLCLASYTVTTDTGTGPFCCDTKGTHVVNWPKLAARSTLLAMGDKCPKLNLIFGCLQELLHPIHSVCFIKCSISSSINKSSRDHTDTYTHVCVMLGLSWAQGSAPWDLELVHGVWCLFLWVCFRFEMP